MQLPYGTVIAVLGFYPGEMKTLSSQRNLYIGIYCGFVCDSPNLEKSQMFFRGVRVTEHDSAIKRGGLLADPSPGRLCRVLPGAERTARPQGRGPHDSICAVLLTQQSYRHRERAVGARNRRRWGAEESGCGCRGSRRRPCEGRPCVSVTA